MEYRWRLEGEGAVCRGLTARSDGQDMTGQDRTVEAQRAGGASLEIEEKRRGEETNSCL